MNFYFKNIFAFSFVLLNFFCTYAQIQDTIYINADSLIKKSIELNSPWRYKLGDDSTWASPLFDHVDWDTVNINLDLEEMTDFNWTGIAWFRKFIKIDSALINKTIGMRLSHWGASEIYLNGVLKKSYGVVSRDSKLEKPFQPHDVPAALQLDSNIVYLIAVRYSNHKAAIEKESFNSWFGLAGFRFRIREINTSVVDAVENAQGNFGLNFGLNGLFLSLSLLYFLLFLFYSRKKENLFYSFFTFLIVVLFFAGMLTRMIQEDLDLIRTIRIMSNIGLA